MDIKTIDDIAWFIPFKKLRNAVRNVLYTLNKIEDNAKIDSMYYNILSDMILYRDRKKVFYLQTPEHRNIGDHAIVHSSKILIKKFFADSVILEYTYNNLLNIGNLIQKFINDNDIIFLPGGGNMGNLYLNEESLRREILKKYSNNKIIIFPVSITFTDDDDGRKELELSKEIYSSCRNLSIMVRDENSYNFALKNFNKNNILLVPDIALYMTNKFQFSSKIRDGIILILRKDKEKILDDNIIDIIIKNIEQKKERYLKYDTYLDYDINIDEREWHINCTLDLISSYKLCITDRFHGMIFSYITKTPCIIFDSLDSKIEYGVKWFKDIDWIHRVSAFDMNEINLLIDKYLYFSDNKKIINYDEIIEREFMNIQNFGEDK
ncbi:polysaccharide pyruvyl transferase family protein [uncultured Brachyspira sp.]|uniref:polysaccharide pyruvyl transferase family protein n=1 Tax=uncultured Brachyspira sp. TaxID=221953 RepID=UPI0025DEF879|nr:polysaccharide pyruvyl transferase family protein [uncultured Brachyspira sp.]